MRVLVTGADGSIGRPLVRELDRLGHQVTATDVGSMDVTDSCAVGWWVETSDPDVIVHLAGAKHAPEGELDPWRVLNVNAIGTRNVLDHGVRVVFASTCKACDPETAYGASKLIAERMVLNAAGVVVRFYNVPEAGGNVFRLWESIPDDEPIPWTNAYRYFVPVRAVVWLVGQALELPSGRYAPVPGPARHMREVAKGLYPGRELMEVPLRRGDRHREPLHAACEWTEQAADGIVRVLGPHDPVLVAA